MENSKGKLYVMKNTKIDFRIKLALFLEVSDFNILFISLYLFWYVIRDAYGLETVI